jgi:hypothetical protein
VLASHELEEKTCKSFRDAHDADADAPPKTGAPAVKIVLEMS